MGKYKDKIIKVLLLVTAFSSVFFLTGIVAVLLYQAIPLFAEVPVFDFVFGKEWYPAYDPPDYGIFPLIMGSFWVTTGAVMLAVPLGVGGAIFISQILPYRLKLLVKPLLEVLAGIPSVVYGFFGIQFLAPFMVKAFNIPLGFNVTTAAIILGIMALPTIMSITEDSLSSVPRSFSDGALSLGATRWEVTMRVLMPAASSGILTAVILGISRSIGETMAVLMVAGGAAIVPLSPFDPVRPLTAAIAAEMGETPVGSMHYHSLFAIGLVLFVITLAFNLLAYSLVKNSKKEVGRI